MPYKDPEDGTTDVDLTADLALDDKELDFEEGFNEDAALHELEQFAKKAKAQTGTRFSLKSRRAIEDHLEHRRLQKEMDYLFGDDFASENPEEAKEP